jgi:hypothetical protein
MRCQISSIIVKSLLCCEQEYCVNTWLNTALQARFNYFYNKSHLIIIQLFLLWKKEVIFYAWSILLDFLQIVEEESDRLREINVCNQSCGKNVTCLLWKGIIFPTVRSVQGVEWHPHRHVYHENLSCGKARTLSFFLDRWCAWC